MALPAVEAALRRLDKGKKGRALVQCGNVLTKFEIEMDTPKDAGVVLHSQALLKEAQELIVLMIQGCASTPARHDSMICYPTEYPWHAMQGRELRKNGLTFRSRTMQDDNTTCAWVLFRLRLLYPHTTNNDEELVAFAEDDRSSVSQMITGPSAVGILSTKSVESDSRSDESPVNQYESMTEFKQPQPTAGEHEEWSKRPSHQELKAAQIELPIEERVKHLYNESHRKTPAKNESNAGSVNSNASKKDNLRHHSEVSVDVSSKRRKLDYQNRGHPILVSPRTTRSGRLIESVSPVDTPKTVEQPRTTRSGTIIGASQLKEVREGSAKDGEDTPSDSTDWSGEENLDTIPPQIRESQGGGLSDAIVSPFKAIGRLLGLA